MPLKQSRFPRLDPRSKEFRDVATGRGIKGPGDPGPKRRPADSLLLHPAQGAPPAQGAWSPMSLVRGKPGPRVGEIPMEAEAAPPEHAQIPEAILAGGHVIRPAGPQNWDVVEINNQISQMEAEGNLEGIENSERMREYQHLVTQRGVLRENGWLNFPSALGITGRPPASGESVYLYHRGETELRTFSVQPFEDRDLLQHAGSLWNRLTFNRMQDWIELRRRNPVVNFLVKTSSISWRGLIVDWSLIKNAIPGILRTYFQPAYTLSAEPRALISGRAGVGEIRQEPIEQAPFVERLEEDAGWQTFSQDVTNFVGLLEAEIPAAIVEVVKSVFSEEVESPVPHDELLGVSRHHVINQIRADDLDGARQTMLLSGVSPEMTEEIIQESVEIRDAPLRRMEDIQDLVDQYNRWMDPKSIIRWTSGRQAQDEMNALFERGSAAVGALRDSYDPEFHSVGMGGWTASYMFLADGQERWEADNRNIWLFILQQGRLPGQDEMRQLTMVNADQGLEFAWQGLTDVFNYVSIPFADDIVRSLGGALGKGVRAAWEMAEHAPVVGRGFVAAREIFRGMAHLSASYVWGRSWGGRIMGTIARATERVTGTDGMLHVIHRMFDRTNPMTSVERVRYGLTDNLMRRFRGLIERLGTEAAPFTERQFVAMVSDAADEVAEARLVVLRREAGAGRTAATDLELVRSANAFASEPRSLVHALSERFRQRYLELRVLPGLGGARGTRYLDEGLIAWAYHQTNEPATIGRVRRILRELGLDSVDPQQLFRDFSRNIDNVWDLHGIPEDAIGRLEGVMVRPSSNVSGLVRAMVAINDTYQGFMSFWTTMVLRARPSFVINNIIDTYFKAIITGSNPFQSLDTILARFQELGTFFPEDLRMVLHSTQLGGRSLEDLALEGRLPRNFVEWFRMGAEEGVRHGRIPAWNGWLGGLGAIWEGTEVTARAATYLRLYETDVSIMAHHLDNWLSTALLESQADPVASALLRSLRYRVSRSTTGYGIANPSRMTEVLDLLAGLRTRGRVPLILSEDLMNRMMNLLGNDPNARAAHAVIEQGVRDILQQGGTPEEIDRSIGQLFDDILAGFEEDQAAQNLQNLRNMPGADVPIDPERMNGAANAVDDAMEAGTLPEVPPDAPPPEAPAHPGPTQNVRPAPRETLTRSWRAGHRQAEITFASDVQRDLYDAGSKLSRTMRGQNPLPASEARAAIASVAGRLGISEDDASALATRVYRDIRDQMRGIADGEARVVVDNVGLPSRAAVEAAPTAIPERIRVEGPTGVWEGTRGEAQAELQRLEDILLGEGAYEEGMQEFYLMREDARLLREALDAMPAAPTAAPEVTVTPAAAPEAADIPPGRNLLDEADAGLRDDIGRLRADGNEAGAQQLNELFSEEGPSIRRDAARAGAQMGRTSAALSNLRADLNEAAQGALQAARTAADVTASRLALEQAAQLNLQSLYLGDLDLALGRFARVGDHRTWVLQWALGGPYTPHLRNMRWRQVYEIIAGEYRAADTILTRALEESQHLMQADPAAFQALVESGELFTPRSFLEAAGYTIELNPDGSLRVLSHTGGAFTTVSSTWGSVPNEFLRGLGFNGTAASPEVATWLDTPVRTLRNQQGELLGAAELIAREQAEAVERIARATRPVTVPEAPPPPSLRQIADRNRELAEHQGLRAVYHGQPDPSAQPGRFGRFGGTLTDAEGYAGLRVGTWTDHQERIRVAYVTEQQYQDGRRAAIRYEFEHGQGVNNVTVAPGPDYERRLQEAIDAATSRTDQPYRYVLFPEGSVEWLPLDASPPGVQAPAPEVAQARAAAQASLQARQENLRRGVWGEMIGPNVQEPFSFDSGRSVNDLYGGQRLPDGRMATDSFDNLAEHLRMRMHAYAAAGDFRREAQIERHLEELISAWEARIMREAEREGIPMGLGSRRFRYPSREMMDPNVVAYFRALDDQTAFVNQFRQLTDDIRSHIRNRMVEGDVLFRQLSPEQQTLIQRIGRGYVENMALGEEAVMSGGEFLGRNYRGVLEETNRIFIGYHQFSQFDRMMKNVVPFWMFPSRSIPFWLGAMVHDPELVGWYLRYMSNTSMVAWQHGFATSRGEPLPSMRGLIPLGNGMWWNPTGPLSMRYVFPNLDYYDLQEMTDQDVGFGTIATSIALRSLSMFGASPSPWVPLLFRVTGTLDADIYQPMGLLPQAQLIPPVANALLKRVARQTTFGRLAMELLDPDASYIDFLVEQQILISFLEQIADPSMTDAQRWALLDTAQNALDMYARGEDPAAQRLWEEAYGHIQTDDWLTATLGYFTGIYPRMHTDADARLLYTRAENARLRWAANDVLGAHMLELPKDIEQMWGIITSRINDVPANYAANLYTAFSWVRVPSGSEPYDPTRESPQAYYDRVSRVSSSYESVDGMSYNVIVAFNIESQRQRHEYMAEWERIRQVRDQALHALPAGNNPAVEIEIQRRYAAEVADLELRYPLAPRDWVIGYKPEQLVYEDFRNLWWHTLLDGAPSWDPDRYEVYADYQRDYQTWLGRLPAIAAPMMREMQTRFAEANFMNAALNRPEDLGLMLVAETNAAGLEQWRIETDDIHSAINYVWVHNFQERYYEEVGKATTPEGRELLERNFLRQFGPDGRPTEEDIIEWMQARYGDRFTVQDIRQGLYGRAILSMEDRQAQNAELRVGEAAAGRDERIWNLLNRVPPGAAYDDFMDTFRRNEGDDGWMEAFRRTTSTADWRNPEDAQQFEAILERTLRELGYNQPVGDEELASRSQAREEQDQFRGLVTGRLGEDFWTTFSWYMSLSQSERAAAREQDPTLSGLIDQYYAMKDMWGMSHPVWAQYYLGEVTTTRGGGGGGGGGGRRGGGGGTRTPTRRLSYIPLGYRGAAEGRELLQAGRRLGSGGAGGNLPPLGGASLTRSGGGGGTTGGLSPEEEELLAKMAEGQEKAKVRK